MTAAGYIPPPWEGIPLSVLFQQLLHAGHSRDEARALLTALAEGRVSPVEITPPLPPGWRFIFLGQGIAVETADGIRDAAKIFLKHSAADRPPFVVSTAADTEASHQAPAAADNEHSVQQPELHPPAIIAANDDAEPAAAPPEPAAWIAAQLNPEDNIARDDVWDKFTLKFPAISKREFSSRLWPEGRKRAGLTARGKSGPKNRKSKKPPA
jgi:hypothetical protein